MSAVRGRRIGSAPRAPAALQVRQAAVVRSALTRDRHEWYERAGEQRLDDLVPGGRCLSTVLPEEKEAVITFALAHPREGYRRLAWMMVDADVAYVSPASVYR